MKKTEKTNTPPQPKDQKKLIKSIQSDSSKIKSPPTIQSSPKSQDTSKVEPSKSPSAIQSSLKSQDISKVEPSKSDAINLPKSIQTEIDLKKKEISKSDLPDIERAKSNLPTTELNTKSKIDSDNESTKSTLDKVRDFLSQHEIESPLSNPDSVQPIDSSTSASFPLDYKQMVVEKKEKLPKIKTIKQVLESRRSDFEEIKAHLERRYAEMKKRIKKIGDKEDEIKDDKKSDRSLILSYHSTEFTPDLDMNLLIKKENDSLTNLDRLKNAIDKELNQQKAECGKNLKQKSRVDECGFTTHAIFAHLAKLQNVKKSFKSNSKSDLTKIDKTIKDNVKDNAVKDNTLKDDTVKDDKVKDNHVKDIMTKKSKETIKTEKNEEVNLIDNKSNNENVKIQNKDNCVKNEDNDQSLSLNNSPKGSSQSIKSNTSIKSIISKHSRE